MLQSARNLDHEIEFFTIEPIQSKIAGVNKAPPLTSKIKLLRCNGSVSFHCNCFENVKSNVKLLYDNVKFHKNDELKALLQQIKTSVAKNFTYFTP